MIILFLSSYSAAAIITKEDELHNIPYLDKFAVSLQNQGLGSGETIWERMRQDFPTLFWRSKAANRINPWLVSPLDICCLEISVEGCKMEYVDFFTRSKIRIESLNDDVIKIYSQNFYILTA